MARKALRILPALADAIGDRPLYVLAASARVGISDFGRIVQGRQTPTEAQAKRIADALGVRIAVVRKACVAADERRTITNSETSAVTAEVSQQPDGGSGDERSEV